MTVVEKFDGTVILASREQCAFNSVIYTTFEQLTIATAQTVNFPRDLNDKALADKFMYIPIDDTQK